MTPIVEAHGLTREFVRRKRLARAVTRAVDGLDLVVQPGEAVGYIGANGAGKSTTIKMLVGILVPTSGTARTCGLDPVRERTALARRVGVVFGQRTQLWWDLPLRESFEVLAAIHALPAERARRIPAADLGWRAVEAEPDLEGWWGGWA